MGQEIDNSSLCIAGQHVMVNHSIFLLYSLV